MSIDVKTGWEVSLCPGYFHRSLNGMSDLALILDKRRQAMKEDLFDQLMMFLGDA